MATISSRGPTLTRALTRAVAGIVGCDEEKVALHLEAPGLDDVTGTVTVELEIVGAAAGAADQPQPEPRETPAEALVEEADAREEVDQIDQEERGVARDVAPEEEGPGAEELDEEADARDEVDQIDQGERDVTEDVAPEEEGPSAEELDEEADAAADFLEGLLDAIDLPGDLRIRVLDDHAEVEVVEIGSGALIGRRGQTLDAIQELVRCALQRQFERRCHVQIDAEGYRARRLEKLLDKAAEAIDDVLDSGEAERLEPMDVFERKAVHQLVAAHDGVRSQSQGREPGRRVVIEPA